MGAEQRNRSPRQPARVASSRRPPPTQSRPPARTVDDDEPTARMDLEATLEAHRLLQMPWSEEQPITSERLLAVPRLPPPPAADRTPLVTVQGAVGAGASRVPTSRWRLATMGLGLLVLGLLVGVGGTVVVMTRRASPIPTVVALDSSPTLKASVSQATRTLVPTIQPSPAHEVSRSAPAASDPRANDIAAQSADSLAVPPEEVTRTEAAKLGLAALPVSSQRAPSCKELLGEPPMKRQSAKAARRETLLANRQLRLGNVAIAHAAYCNAVALDGSNADRQVNLARLYLVRRDWGKAAELAQGALTLAPKNRAALGVLGDAWAAMNKYDEARTAMLAAEGKPHATSGELRLIAKRNMALADRVARLNDFLLAERLYRRVLLADPHQTGAMKGIARCLLKAGDVRVAEAWARQGKRLRGAL